MEKDIQLSILQYLDFKKIFHWRNNTGAIKTDQGRFLRFGAVGSPDIFILKHGLLYGIEVKTEKGKQSDAQKAFEEAFAKAGGHYRIARSLDDVIALFP